MADRSCPTPNGLTPRPAPPRKTRRTRFIALGVVLCLTILLLRSGCRREPPDLTACTRIEVQCKAGALNYFFRDSVMQECILNEAERESVRSYDTWAVTDQEQIKAFAYKIGQGTYAGRILGTTEIRAKIVGHSRGRWPISFSVTGGSSIIASGRRLFSYSAWCGLSLADLDPPGIKPLQTRWKCAENLYRLRNGLWPYAREPRPHVDPNRWCDTIVEHSRRAQWFTCPSVPAATDEDDSSGQSPKTRASDYAMNSNYREGSPDDMVFLFESKPGWNQHGGPELFTFDNHDPKGGCVLLNDGTIKFIRTKEELGALRWE